MSTSFLGSVSVVVPAMGLVTALVILTGLLFAVVSVLVYRPLRIYFAVRRAEAHLKQLQLEFERTWWPLELLREVLAIRLAAEDDVRREVSARFPGLSEKMLHFTWSPTLFAAMFRWRAMRARLYATGLYPEVWRMRREQLRDLCLTWAQDRLAEGQRNAVWLSIDSELRFVHPALDACLKGVLAEIATAEECLAAIENSDQDFDGRFGRQLMHQRSLLAQIQHLVNPPRRQASA